MQFKMSGLVFVLVILSTAINASAEDPEVIVGEIGFPKRVWGTGTLEFDVTNRTDWLKFLVVETDVTFEGSYVNPHRVTRTPFVLEPSAKTRFEPRIVIPSNYGLMKLWVRLYDVVDTLDVLAAGTKLFEQPFNIRFHVPEAVIPYFQERITLPPLVGHYGLFDNEFTRLLLVLANEGKTVPQIAAMCETDTAFVAECVLGLAAARFVSRSGDSLKVLTPVITKAEAVEGRELADRIADRLARKLAENLGRRRPFLDSLISAGVASGDSTGFNTGARVLFQPHPLVGGMLLWQVLGQKFITGSRSLEIFYGTDFCNPRIGPFMYLVLGGDYFNGHHFYWAQAKASGYESRFGDSIPPITCWPGYEKKLTLYENTDWSFGQGLDARETFLYDTAMVIPMMRMLDQDTESILSDALEELRHLNKKCREGDLSVAVRYWFWNLVASGTLDRLVKNGVAYRVRRGQYQYQEIRL
ncbi:MAG: hypothetical protein AB1772_04685 [Candidatus Zixiibacteriota bacterium]